MTRKDTIILAVLFNLVVLAGVLVTARQLVPPAEGTKAVRRQMASEAAQEWTEPEAVPEEAMVFDEIDQLLEDYIADEPEPTAQPEASPMKKSIPKGKPAADVFYTIKPGDNPWKVAKRFHLSFEKLLSLNHLDEAKARNLKVGQQIRIREE